MSTTAASDTKKRRRPNNEHLQSRLSFASLPDDLVLNILAGVPRRYHPILSCVSNKFRSLVRSPVLHEMRSLLGKDSFYVFIKEYDGPSTSYHWFTLIENRLVSIPFPSQPDQYSAALMVGSHIYFVGNYVNTLGNWRRMWILDSQSGKLREGPSTRVARRFAAAGVVDDKIFMFGGYEEIQVEVFDTKTRTWEIAANPNLKKEWIWMSAISPSLDRKFYSRNAERQVIVYDPRDGKCKKIDIPNNSSRKVCVIDNVLYIYGSWLGLMWYDSKENEWRVVGGLKLNKYSASELAEYNGKLVMFPQGKNKGEIWCAMITLDRSGVEITGKVEWFDCVLSVPYDYHIMHCFGRTD